MRTAEAAWALCLVICAAPAQADSCAAPGDPVHWRADFCMQQLETDDEIAVSACMEQEGKRRFGERCAAATHFKKRMCEVALKNGTRTGSVDACVKDRSFQGRTVRNRGVGAP